MLAVTGPLGVVRRLLRRYVTPLLAIALAYLLIALLRDADLGIAATGGLPVMVALDIVVAYNASWLPLAPDYTRFSGRPVAPLWVAATGFFAGTSLVFTIGFLVGTLGGVTDTNSVVTALGGLASVARDRRDRRRREREDLRQRLLDRGLGPEPRAARLAAPADRAIGVVATVIAYQLSIWRFFDFLLLLGAVFVPLFGAVIADHFRPPHPVVTAVAWAAGFVTYQWLSPTGVDARLLGRAVDRRRAPLPVLPLGGGSWGASLPAFAVAFGSVGSVAGAGARVPRPRPERSRAPGSMTRGPAVSSYLDRD